MGKVWEGKGSLQGGPKRTGGALLRREAAGSLGPGHKMAAAPLGLLVQDRGAAVRCSRPGRRRQPRRSQLQEGQAEKGKPLSEAEAEGSARARRAAARAESLRAKGKAGVADCPGVGGQAAEPAEAAGPRAGPQRGGDCGGGARAAGKLGGRRAGTRGRALGAGPRTAAAAGVASLNCGRGRSRFRASGGSGRWALILSVGFEAGLPRPPPSGAWAALRSRAGARLTDRPRGAETAGGEGGGARLTVSWTGRRPRGPCPGGTSTSPPPNASSKVPSVPGLPVDPRETAPGRAKARGRREGAEDRRREGGGVPGGAHPGGGPGGGVGDGRPGSPPGLPPRGRRAFSVAPGPVASWRLLIYLP